MAQGRQQHADFMEKVNAKYPDTQSNQPQPDNSPPEAENNPSNSLQKPDNRVLMSPASQVEAGKSGEGKAMNTEKYSDKSELEKIKGRERVIDTLSKKGVIKKWVSPDGKIERHYPSAALDRAVYDDALDNHGFSLSFYFKNPAEDTGDDLIKIYGSDYEGGADLTPEQIKVGKEIIKKHLKG